MSRRQLIAGLRNPSSPKPFDGQRKHTVRVVLECRLIGVMRGEQTDHKKKTRNDRIVAVQDDTHSYSAFKHIRDLGKPFVRELEEFFCELPQEVVDGPLGLRLVKGCRRDFEND